MQGYTEQLTNQIVDGRYLYPFTDPKKCSKEELEEILSTDPTASLEYKNELNKRLFTEQEEHYWEEKLKNKTIK